MLVNSYEGLIKDKAIIAAEVMHEYDEKVCRIGLEANRWTNLHLVRHSTD